MAAILDGKETWVFVGNETCSNRADREVLIQGRNDSFQYVGYINGKPRPYATIAGGRNGRKAQVVWTNPKMTKRTMDRLELHFAKMWYFIH